MIQCTGCNLLFVKVPSIPNFCLFSLSSHLSQGIDAHLFFQGQILTLMLISFLLYFSWLCLLSKLFIVSFFPLVTLLLTYSMYFLLKFQHKTFFFFTINFYSSKSYRFPQHSNPLWPLLSLISLMEVFCITLIVI